MEGEKQEVSQFYAYQIKALEVGQVHSTHLEIRNYIIFLFRCKWKDGIIS
jgi:hypothetical protein